MSPDTEALALSANTGCSIALARVVATLMRRVAALESELAALRAARPAAWTAAETPALDPDELAF